MTTYFSITLSNNYNCPGRHWFVPRFGHATRAAARRHILKFLNEKPHHLFTVSSDERDDLMEAMTIFHDYQENDLIEDRSEYDVDLLKDSENISLEAAKFLFRLIDNY